MTSRRRATSPSRTPREKAPAAEACQQTDVIPSRRTGNDSAARSVPSGETTPKATVVLKPHRAVFVANAAGPASECVESLGVGARIVGVTKGQFGLTELLGAVLRKVRPEHGPADVMGWAWSMAPDDARMVAAMRAEGLIRELVVIFDRSFPTRHPEWVPLLRESLGHAIYATNNHAKVVLVRAGALRLVIQSSMNFNINRRFEHFSVEDDAALFAHWEELTRWMCEHTPAGLESVLGPQYHEGFKAALGGGLAVGGAPTVDGDDFDALMDSLGDAHAEGLDLDALLEGL